MQTGHGEEWPLRVLIGSSCERWLQAPETHHEETEVFSMKHALQQASIIGNMEAFGVHQEIMLNNMLAFGKVLAGIACVSLPPEDYGVLGR